MNHPGHGGAISHAADAPGPWPVCLACVPRAHPRPTLRYVRAITRHFARVNIPLHLPSESVPSAYSRITLTDAFFPCYRTEQLRVFDLQGARALRLAIGPARAARARREDLRGEHAAAAAEQAEPFVIEHLLI